jgi:ubiquinone/menaquinone biosynthesis C-methylase UbiE
MQIGTHHSTYNDYVTEEWRMFEDNQTRRNALLNAVKSVQVRRVLDIGCGAGQEMLPFVEHGASAVGMDVMPEVGQVGGKMFASKGFGEKVSFMRASGDELPFEDESFDVLICRGALMFMNNAKALKEMARVLSPGGVFFLMVQAPPYYWNKAGKGLRTGNVLSSVHAARVLLAGNYYLLTGKQSYGKLTAAGEIFQTRKSLSRALAPLGLKITGEMPDTNPQTPSFIITKNGLK